MSVTTCQHIQSAMRCCADAQVLPIDSDVLKSLSISNQMKEVSILRFANSWEKIGCFSRNLFEIL